MKRKLTGDTFHWACYPGVYKAQLFTESVERHFSIESKHFDSNYFNEINKFIEDNHKYFYSPEDPDDYRFDGLTVFDAISILRKRGKLVNDAKHSKRRNNTFDQFLNFLSRGLYDNYGPTRKADFGKHWTMFNLY